MNGGQLGLLALACSMVMIGIAHADEAAAAKTETVDPTGSYKWEYSFNDNPSEFSLKLNWDGKELSGTYTAFNNTTEIEETKFTPDNKISFLANREFNGNKFTVHFDGELKPEEIVGTVAVDFGQGPQEFDWTARRVIDADDVLGVWKFRVETPQGVIEPQLTITKDGDKLHGDYVSPFGEREAKDVTLKNGELSWRIESDEDDDFDFVVKYRGKPRGNRISGVGEFDFGGNTGEMEFTGELTPPADEKPAAAESAAEVKPAAPAAAVPAATAPAE
jgi:hypothetical protein